MANKELRAVTRFFFDRAAVTNSIDAGARRALTRFGAFVRRRARSSIRKRKKISEPGKPPSSREGSLRRLILFAYDPSARSVVVGPIPFKEGVAPRLLEYGGQVPGNGRVVWFTNEPGRDTSGRFVSTGRRRVVLNGTLRYRPRPFMTPAFEAELPGAALMFANMIK